MDLADAIVQTARPSICLDKEKTNYAKAGQRSTQHTRLYVFCGTIKTTKGHQSASNHRSIDHSYNVSSPIHISIHHKIMDDHLSSIHHLSYQF